MPWSPGVVGKAGRVWLPSFLLLSGGGRMWVRDKALISDRALHFLEHPSTKTTNVPSHVPRYYQRENTSTNESCTQTECLDEHLAKNHAGCLVVSLRPSNIHAKLPLPPTCSPIAR
ncbi:hypothetical protein I7I51_09191 [Histoplasma capsulatum]|uniref:Secreted protein n=1 Tax=Ajellomyces capsulatus TaxID=5037 RepID=A0A8A1M2E6_AJECA|nr:hypothetical protein I7I51_09191 [Histoplasma capsulatum]